MLKISYSPFQLIHLISSLPLSAQLCLVSNVLGVSLCLWGDARGSQRILGFGKLTASSAFVTLALLATPHAELLSYQWALTAALVASWVGDAALIGQSERAFLGGLGAFFLAHLLYAWAALELIAWAPQPSVLGLVVGAGVVGAWVLSLLKPHIPHKLWRPTIAYSGVISVMVGLCAHASLITERPLLLAGALAFWLSDLSVARDRFLNTGFRGRLWGIPLYFIAQLMLALTLYKEARF